MKMVRAMHVMVATRPAIAKAQAAAVMRAIPPAVAGWVV